MEFFPETAQSPPQQIPVQSVPAFFVDPLLCDFGWWKIGPTLQVNKQWMTFNRTTQWLETCGFVSRWLNALQSSQQCSTLIFPMKLQIIAQCWRLMAKLSTSFAFAQVTILSSQWWQHMKHVTADLHITMDWIDLCSWLCCGNLSWTNTVSTIQLIDLPFTKSTKQTCPVCVDGKDTFANLNTGQSFWSINLPDETWFVCSSTVVMFRTCSMQSLQCAQDNGMDLILDENTVDANCFDAKKFDACSSIWMQCVSGATQNDFCMNFCAAV